MSMIHKIFQFLPKQFRTGNTKLLLGIIVASLVIFFMGTAGLFLLFFFLLLSLIGHSFAWIPQIFQGAPAFAFPDILSVIGIHLPQGTLNQPEQVNSFIDQLQQQYLQGGTTQNEESDMGEVAGESSEY